MEKEGPMSEGRWVTINGSKVFIENGVPTKGGSFLKDKKHPTKKTGNKPSSKKPVNDDKITAAAREAAGLPAVPEGVQKNSQRALSKEKSWENWREIKEAGIDEEKYPFVYKSDRVITEKIEGSMVGGKFLATKEPLRMEQVSEMGLVTANKYSKAKLAMEHYSRVYGVDDSIVVQKTLGGEFGAALYKSVREKGKWQCSNFQAGKGFISHDVFDSFEEGVIELMNRDYPQLVSPQEFEKIFHNFEPMVYSKHELNVLKEEKEQRKRRANG
jgi:hypothetical protein